MIVYDLNGFGRGLGGFGVDSGHGWGGIALIWEVVGNDGKMTGK